MERGGWKGSSRFSPVLLDAPCLASGPKQFLPRYLLVFLCCVKDIYLRFGLGHNLTFPNFFVVAYISSLSLVMEDIAIY